MKHIYLIRHGETIFNSIGKIQGGGLDSELTDKGIQYAIQLGNKLKNSNFKVDRIISSPQKRAYKTAELVSSYMNLRIETNDLLKEIDCGSMEGMELTKMDPAKLDRLRRFPDEHYTDGENVEDVIERGKKFLEHLNTLEGNSVLIVSHGNWTRCFTTAAIGMPSIFAMRIFMDNTGFTYLYQELDHYRIVLWNDLSHISGIPRR